jgi:sec-independent protein translocase protein TatA
MPTLIVLFGPVGPELLVILLLLLVLFGGDKIQKVAKGSGKAIAEFKRGEKEGKQNFSQAANPQPKTHTDRKGDSKQISKPDVSDTDVETSNGHSSVVDSEESQDTERISPEEANIPDLTKNK